MAMMKGIGRATFLGVCAIASVLAVGRPACAQILPRPEPVEFAKAADTLAGSGVPISRSAFLAAYSAYLDEFEALAVRADQDLQHIREQSRTAPGSFLAVRDTVRANEITERVAKEHGEAIRRMCERLKPAAPSDELVTKLDTARALLTLQAMLKTRFSYRYPGDISMHLAAPANAANLGGRMRAYESLAASQAEQRLRVARIAEELEVVGKSQVDLSGAHPELWRNAVDVSDPGWIAVVREQMVAYRSIEASLSAADNSWVHDQLMPWLLNRTPSPLLVKADGTSIETPAELVRSLLRIEHLTNEQRAKVREIGRKMISKQRASTREAVEQLVSTGSYADDEGVRTWLLEQFLPIWQAAGLSTSDTEMENPFQPAKLLTALSAADTDEFGGVLMEDAEGGVFGALTNLTKLIPVRPDDKFRADLYAWLAIPESRHPVVEAILHDACDCWDRDVKPIPPTSNQAFASWEPDADQKLAAYEEQATRRYEMSQQAFAAAQACDRAMFESLAVALGSTVSKPALALVESSRRTGANPGPSWAPMFRCEPDFLRAVFESPMSDASRRAAIAALAPDVAVWNAAAALLLQSRLWQNWLSFSFIEWQVKDDQAAAKRQHQVDDIEQLRMRSIATWKSSVSSATQAVSLVVTPGELDAWNACLQRLEWPGIYPDLDPLARQVERIFSDAAQSPDTPEAQEIRATVQRILASARAEIQRTGDATRQTGMYQHPLIGVNKNWGPAMQEWNKRMSTLMSINAIRLQLAEERVRLALPPDRAGRLAGKSALSALAP